MKAYRKEWHPDGQFPQRRWLCPLQPGLGVGVRGEGKEPGVLGKAMEPMEQLMGAWGSLWFEPDVVPGTHMAVS